MRESRSWAYSVPHQSGAGAFAQLLTAPACSSFDASPFRKAIQSNLVEEVGIAFQWFSHGRQPLDRPTPNLPWLKSCTLIGFS